jgi:hypothetical protein
MVATTAEDFLPDVNRHWHFWSGVTIRGDFDLCLCVPNGTPGCVDKFAKLPIFAVERLADYFST